VGFDIASIKSSRQARPRRVILLGKPKSGKSTFASQAGRPIFIPIRGEEGIDDLDVPSFPVVTNYAELMEALGVLAESEHDYGTVVIDSVSTLEPIIWRECCRINQGVDSIEKVGGGFAKGYIECLKQWGEVLDCIDYIRSVRNMGCILIGHTAVGKANDPMCEPYDRYTFDVHKKAVEKLTRWADGILFCMHKITVKKDEAGGFKKTQNRAIEIGGGVPYLYTQERPSHPGGGRGPWGKLPYELPLSWLAFDQALAQASKAPA
jgi:hypothetical protein